MKITSSYAVEIKKQKMFDNTIKIYREAVSFLIGCFNKEWDSICVSVSDKEFARLHSKYNLKKEDVLEAIKAYAQELGLEYGPVNYFMMCDPKYANDLGEVVQ